MKTLKKIIVALIAVVMSFSASSVAVFAAESEYKLTDSFNADKVSVQTYANADGAEVPQSIFYGEVKLGDGYSMVLHTILENGKYKLSTVSELAADYESKHENSTVMMAINGGFFDGAFNDDEKLPEGALAIDGALYDDGFKSKTNHENAFGWTADGKYVSGSIHVGQTEYVMRVTMKDGTREVFALRPDNSDLADYGVCLYTQNGNVANSVKFRAKVSVADKRLSVYNGVEKINDKADSENFTVGENEIVIVARETLSAVKALNQAEKVEIYNRSKDEIFEESDYIVDVFNDLVANGKAKLGFKGAGHATTAAPRTTIGYFDDGRVFFSVADGRQDGYAKGLTCAQQAAFAETKGCAFAYELDGGGSSTFLIRKDGELVCMNKPSEGKQRKILDAVLIVKTTDKTINVDKIVENNDLEVTEGNCESIILASGISEADVTFTSDDESVASVDESGIITAKKAGTCKISVSYLGKTEEVTVTVNAASKSDKTSSSGCKGSAGESMTFVFVALLAAVITVSSKRKKN